MLKEIKNLVAFLTIMPVGVDEDCLTDAAKYMPLFPLVGALIGSLAGLFAWLLFKILPTLVVGMLTTGSLLLITGLHHTDGLLDFGDGVMYQGPPEKKIEIMHDQNTGAGGLTLGLITLLTTALCVAELNPNIVIRSLVVSEVTAKLSMVVGAWIGKSAHKGINTYFVNAMHGQHRKTRLTVALAISFFIATYLLWIRGSITVISGIIASLVMVGVSNRHFRGITGDVLGAMNELTRMTSLITILAVVRWA
nr:adenosylcobinamide-GDP ribazoletransferase [Candidatus Njordarchaeota archaeon]